MAFRHFGFDLDGIEDFVGGHLRLFISLTLGILFFVGMIALSVFFIAVRGKEQVMVPNVTGKDLTKALLELQQKELYPRIQLRNSESASERGIVLEQNPEGGTIVKAERRINLVISAGVALDKVGNYLGKDINAVRSELQGMRAAAGQNTLTISEPVMYQEDKAAAGTVIQQKPAAGADITGPTQLELVVSRGPGNAMLTVPDFVGMTLADALEKIGKTNLTVNFTLRQGGAENESETVADQDPAPGSEIPAAQRVTLTLYAPRNNEGEVSGLFRYSLPRNPYPLPVAVFAELPDGSRRPLLSANHPGGEFTLPYHLPRGSIIILTMMDRELYRQVLDGAGESGEHEEALNDL